MRYVLSCTLLALAACSTAPPVPERPPKVVVVERPVAVFEACPVQWPEEPDLCVVPATATDPEWLRCRLANYPRLEGYVRDLKAQLAVCAETPK